jgi:hypothetical protein
MARRPEETRGVLVFQEGKRIEGGYYIIAVYDDPATKTVSFAAYELETDYTYTHPLSYSELDGLFKYNSELMNPSNRDGRYHWVIERLDFVQDARGRKVLCLAPEPTPEDLEDIPEQKPASKKTFHAGKIDAQLRQKLIGEMDTANDHANYVRLVRSEDARKRFLAELHSKRMLEQLKATQRMLKMDEERDARMAKLEYIKASTQAKAQKYRSENEMKTQTTAQLDVLIKQKDAEAIRRLMKDKEEQKHSAETQGEQNRQKRKARERSWKEQRDVEQEKMRLLEKKRNEAVKKREALVTKRCKEIARETREGIEAKRRIEMERLEKKEELLVKIEEEKAQARKAKREEQEMWEDLENVREANNLERELKRNQTEKKYLDDMRKQEKEQREAMLARRWKAYSAQLLQWKLQTAGRASAKREQARKDEQRAGKIQARDDERVRQRREEEYLRRAQEEKDRMEQKSSAKKEKGSTQKKELKATEGVAADSDEEDGFQKLFEQQERERRHGAREAKRAREQDKMKSIEQLGSNASKRNQGEVLRYEQAKQKEYQVKSRAEEARLRRENDRLEAEKTQAEAREMREDLFDRLDAVREVRHEEREGARLQACLGNVKKKRLGGALPMVLAI